MKALVIFYDEDIGRPKLAEQEKKLSGIGTIRLLINSKKLNWKC